MPFLSKHWFLTPCPLCLARVPHAGLCSACAAELPRLPVMHCQRCAEPLVGTQTEECARCLSDPPPYDRAYCALAYAPPVSILISWFKYHHMLRLTETLAHLMLAYVRTRSEPLPDCILPVPLHPVRIRERGFNQATEIARSLSRHTRVPYDKACVVRIKKTPPQTSLKRALREKNLKGAFALRRRPPPGRIAVLDDVMTTGTTFAEIAKLLKRNGVEYIEVWSLARTIRV